jgi:transcriptional regulator with XRE-family HTH domain
MYQKKISAAQLRAARAMLGLKQDEVADASLVARPTITEIESGRRVPHARTMADLIRVYESCGIEFIAEADGAGPGIRLAWPERDAPDVKARLAAVWQRSGGGRP